MTGPAVQSGSALGGFIEGALGGFERTTEFRRQRRLEQQVAQQIQDRAEDRQMRQRLEALNLYNEHGIGWIGAGSPEGEGVGDAVAGIGQEPVSVNWDRGVDRDPTLDLFRGAVGQGLSDPDPQRTAFLASIGMEQIGPSAKDREESQARVYQSLMSRYFEGTPEEREGFLTYPDMRKALIWYGQFDKEVSSVLRPTVPTPSPPRFGVTGSGGRTITGATREQADRFAAEFSPTSRSVSASGDLTVLQAFQILKDHYAEWDDDGTFVGYSEAFDVMLAQAREMAGGGPMTPRPTQPVEEEGPDFFARLGQSKAAQFFLKVGRTITPGGERGFLPSKAEEETPEEEKDPFALYNQLWDQLVASGLSEEEATRQAQQRFKQ